MSEQELKAVDSQNLQKNAVDPNPIPGEHDQINDTQARNLAPLTEPQAEEHAQTPQALPTTTQDPFQNQQSPAVFAANPIINQDTGQIAEARASPAAIDIRSHVYTPLDNEMPGLHNPKGTFVTKYAMEVCNYDGQEFKISWTGFANLTDANPYPSDIGEIQVEHPQKIRYVGRFEPAVHPEGRRFLDLASVIIYIYYPDGSSYQGKGFFGSRRTG